MARPLRLDIPGARHLIELTRYVVLNPVLAGIVADVAEWPWSSYRAAVGLETAPGWLCVDRVIAPARIATLRSWPATLRGAKP